MVKKKLNKKRKCVNLLKNVKRTGKYLQISSNVQTKLFFEKSTLHGVRYIAESGRPFIERYVLTKYFLYKSNEGLKKL